MTLFIYNINNQNAFSEGIAIAEDIDLLWSGKDWAEFEKETGLSQAEIGGLIKQDGKLVFSIEKKAESEKQKLPIATGKNLLSYLVTTIRQQSSQEGLKPSGKSVKLNRFQNIFQKWKFEDNQIGDLWNYLQIEEEFTQAEFNDFVKSITDSQDLNNANGKKVIVDAVLLLISKWAESVRFIK